jgi:hypothetical protein
VTDTSMIARASASILAVMDGLQLQWLLDPSAVELAEASAFAIRAIVNGSSTRVRPSRPTSRRPQPCGAPAEPASRSARADRTSADGTRRHATNQDRWRIRVGSAL